MTKLSLDKIDDACLDLDLEAISTQTEQFDIFIDWPRAGPGPGSRLLFA